MRFLLLIAIFLIVSCSDDDEKEKEKGLPYDSENCEIIENRRSRNCDGVKGCSTGWVFVSCEIRPAPNHHRHTRCCMGRISAVVQAIEYASFEDFQNCQAVYSKEHNEIQFTDCL